MKSGLYVGISFHLADSADDIWANGAVQNVIFMYQTFAAMNSVAKVCLAYAGGAEKPPAGLLLDGIELNFVPLERAAQEVDVMIEMGLVLSPSITSQVRERGGKTVSMRVGNDFLMDMERFVFNQPHTRLFNGAEYHAVWTIPQHERSCRAYFGIMLRAPVYVLPHIWSPVFVDKVAEVIKENSYVFEYQAKSGAKRIAILERNITVMKTCHIPILICEQAYRQSPQSIAHVYACNTYRKREHPSFHNFIGRTDLVRNNILTVEATYQTPDFMARYTDIVIAYQWENALNYAYYETLYGGYPLIHNSPMLPLGYYYPDFDAHMGAQVLLDVIQNHDKRQQVYRDEAERYLARLSPVHPLNVQAYERALQDLFFDYSLS